jgi:hypothetical protein
MNILQAFGIFLFGAGLGALLMWVPQTAARKHYRQELETQIDHALFGGLRRHRLDHIRQESEPGATASLEHINAKKPSRII